MTRLFVKFLFIAILSFSSIAVYGQNESKIDSLKIELTKAKNDSNRAIISNEIATHYYRTSNYQKSIEFNLKTFKLHESLNNKSGQGNSYSQIGVVYYRMKNWEKSIEYLKRALEIAKEANDVEDQGRFLNNLGNAFEKKKDYNKALEYHQKALIIKHEIGDSLSISKSLSNIGNLYYHRKDYAKAINFYEKSLKIKRNGDDDIGLSNVLQNIGFTYYQKGDYRKALTYVNEGLGFAEKADNLYYQISAYGKLGDIYYALKEYKNSHDFLSLQNKLSDSLDQINNAKLIAEMDAKFEAEKKDNEIALQQVEIEKEKTKVALQTTQKIWFAIGLFLALVLLIVAYWGFRQKQKANIQLEEKNAIIEEKNRDITDSITYASSIQQSILPDVRSISKVIPEHFIFYKPKDIVSGDFYWFHEKEDLAFIVAADCTGHGVPGAFVSMLCNNVLNQIIIENDINDPGEILTQVNKLINASLNNNGGSFTSTDGMDCSLCVINKKTKELSYAGAFNQLIIINNGEIKEVKADRTPIGGRTDVDFKFKSNKIETKEGNFYYLFSDGYSDQFGGPKGKKFMIKNLKQLFAAIYKQPFNMQKKYLDDTLKEWQGDLEQVDDILVIGFKI